MNSKPSETILSRDLVRERLTNQVLDATTLEEIDSARQALRNWIKMYPHEIGMEDAFEQLSLLEDIALEEAKRLVERGAWLYTHS